jgi:HD-GYP domain-containing protein (c-di-GMP phosphodiesterase class II)
MEGLAFDSESLSGSIYETGYFSQEVSHLLASIIMDFPDKAITVVLSLLICRFIPKKHHGLFRLTGWLQSPMTKEEEAAVKRNKYRVRFLSLRIKIIIVLIISLSTVAVGGTIIGVRVYYKTMINEHTALAQGTATLAAKELDGDRINEYLAENGDSDDYRRTYRLFEDILYSSPDIAYLYVYKIEQDGCRVILDIDTEEVEGDTIGTLLSFEEGFVSHIPQTDKLMAGEEIEPFTTQDKYGYLLTALKPVYDSDGKCQCYVFADVDVEELIKEERSFLTEMVTLFLGFLIMICVFVIWLTDYHIIYPISSITMQADGISRTKSTQEVDDGNIRKIRGLNIRTGDEIELLYNSVCSMTENQTEQMSSIKRLSDSTAKMQDGLIITMADMVENRDSDTGDHVQKTAAYVRIIVEGLKRHGYYPGKITPKFISDVVRSAPLHDVGKITIPDGVLNKPGRLTDEEYEIMKTHTTAGKKIVENAIISVEGASYLKEARNMAAYHHERWDGKGYPEKLHGEVIPLSARIMAVADVFDALTSPRVYKPAFPLEKALAIIEEGKGTQFDPKCVEVFMDSLPEVVEVLRKHSPSAREAKYK